MLGQLIREIIMGHGFSVDRLEYLTAHLDKYVDDGRFPGCSCLVMRHGEEAYFQAFGRRDVDRDLAMERDTVVRRSEERRVGKAGRSRGAPYP